MQLIISPIIVLSLVSSLVSATQQQKDACSLIEDPVSCRSNGPIYCDWNSTLNVCEYSDAAVAPKCAARTSIKPCEDQSIFCQWKSSICSPKNFFFPGSMAAAAKSRCRTLVDEINSSDQFNNCVQAYELDCAYDVQTDQRTCVRVFGTYKAPTSNIPQLIFF